MSTTSTCIEDKLSGPERILKMESSKLPHGLRIAKRVLHTQSAKRRRTGASRMPTKCLSSLEIIPETTNSLGSDTVTPENKRGTTEDEISRNVLPNNINMDHCSDAENTNLTQWNDLLSLKSHRDGCPSDLTLPLRTSGSHANAAQLQNQIIIKSGAAVLITQEHKENVCGDRKVGSPNNSDTDDSSSCFCCRTPVTLKVYHSSCGDYVVVNPSRHHLGVVQPFCLRLRKCYVSLDNEIKQSSSEALETLNSTPCRFYLSVGGAADGKKFTFEAGSRDSAREWAKVLSCDGGRESGTQGLNSLFHMSEVKKYFRPVDTNISTWCDRVDATESKHTRRKLRERQHSVHVPSLDDVIEEMESQPIKSMTESNNKNQSFILTVMKNEKYDKAGEKEIKVSDSKIHKLDMKLKLHTDCITDKLTPDDDTTPKQSVACVAKLSSRLSLMSESCCPPSNLVNVRKDRHLPTLSESSEEDDDSD